MVTRRPRRPLWTSWVITRDWMYQEHPSRSEDTVRREFYDLRRDQRAWFNRAADAAVQDELKRHRALLHSYFPNLRRDKRP